MRPDEAISIRRDQLQGKPVDPMLAQEALMLIRNRPRHRTGPQYRNLTNPFGLTAAQVQVMDMVVQGKTFAQIGNVLGIDARTVGTQVTRAKVRMGADSRMMAVLMWDRERRDLNRAVTV